jgi:type IV pilus assembly protein PilW
MNKDRLQSGFGLVEIMVAMVIGLFLMGGLIQIFLGNKQAFLVQEAQARLQENARMASVFLSSNLGKAGFHQNAQDDATTIFTAANLALSGTNDNANGGDTILDGTDAITVRFEGDGNITDCRGNGVAAGALSTNIYRIDTSNELECSADGGTTFQPLIENVENMQVLYGEDTDADGVVDQYRDAGGVANFDNVLSIHVALLLASSREIKLNAESKTYTLVGTGVTEPASGTDRIQRRVVERVVALRNRLL